MRLTLDYLPTRRIHINKETYNAFAYNSFSVYTADFLFAHLYAVLGPVWPRK